MSSLELGRVVIPGEVSLRRRRVRTSVAPVSDPTDAEEDAGTANAEGECDGSCRSLLPSSSSSRSRFCLPGLCTSVLAPAGGPKFRGVLDVLEDPGLGAEADMFAAEAVTVSLLAIGDEAREPREVGFLESTAELWWESDCCCCALPVMLGGKEGVTGVRG